MLCLVCFFFLKKRDRHYILVRHVWPPCLARSHFRRDELGTRGFEPSPSRASRCGSLLAEVGAAGEAAARSVCSTCPGRTRLPRPRKSVWVTRERPLVGRALWRQRRGNSQSDWAVYSEAPAEQRILRPLGGRVVPSASSPGKRSLLGWLGSALPCNGARPGDNGVVWG